MLRARIKTLSREDHIAYIGTGVLLVAPYLVGNGNIGFILLVIGIALLTPQCYKANQWNLVILNISSCIGYSLQIFNIL